jgi:glycosyltransferase involved in cell wall biosynthesis
MSDHPLVSIIIPTYNRAHLIGETLDSVVAQTYENWECIIVDDGSSDNTDEVIEEYTKKDTRFKYYHRPEEHLPGGNGARNYGFKMSQGEYVQWFDSDDLMVAEMIEKKTRMFISNLKLDAVSCGFKVFGEVIDSKEKNIIFVEDFIYESLRKKFVLNLETFMFSKDSLIGLKYSENLTRAQDLDFCFRFFKTKDKKVSQIYSSLILIRQHSYSITGRFQYKNLPDLKSELKIRKEILKYAYFELDKKSLELALDYYIRVLHQAIRNKKLYLIFMSVLSVFYIKPFSFIKFLALCILYLMFRKGDMILKKMYTDQIK